MINNMTWIDKTDLAWMFFAGGTVCDASRAAVEVFKDDFLSLDDQLTDATCINFSKNNTLQIENSLSIQTE